MELQRFGLKRRPFPPTPDTSLYYPSSLHEAALTALGRGLEDGESFVLLTGDAGLGKTLLAYALLERLGDQTASAFLTNSHFPDRSSLLQAILYDLGLPHDDAREQTLRLRLTDQLLKNCAAQRRTIVVIDEAHHLSVDLLEELRLLANLEAGSDKAVQFVLCAQPDIARALKQPEMSGLQQRIAVRSALGPLPVEEACDYLLHHLRCAGAKAEKVFDDTALEVIARGAQGIPRCLNQAAHQALVLAEEGELPKVDAEAALEALSMLGMSSGEEEASEAATDHPKIQSFLRTA
ncbi:MAG: AAA family ATPase [Planctomycetes bacterium]|nr:AAA family ATPase [Planctomycetota bacterium]